MGLSRFFIDRAIFAWVIAIAVMMAGVGSIMNLPIAQYPDVAPPSVSVNATYPGASAETLQTSVTQIIEQQLTGVDNLLYFSSNSSSSGTARITVTFAKGTNPDTAQVQVQNKVQQAMTRLPQEVQAQGVTVTKSNSDFLMIVGLYDNTDKSSDSDVADYLVSHFQDDLARVNGVGNVQVFGSQYAMRIWLDPVKLAARQLMPSDVEAAISSQNVDLSAGQVGQQPQVRGQMLNAVVKAKSRLQTPDQFKGIVVKAGSDGSIVRLSDVARVEMGQEDYTSSAHLNGHPSSGIAIQLAPGADALKTSTAVKARVQEISASLPNGYAIAYPRDSSDFVRLSVKEVVETLVIAVVLVVAVMYLFLQSWRATLVPAIAVPVVLLGTFGVLALFGYSINTLTLFAMVLAIGLLVDDAIVVVENVERIMDEEGLNPHDATVKSMDEIGSALIGVATVLSAVMLPMAFFGGSTGVIYRQFSVTMVSAMLLSVVVALVLSPALCATLLRPADTKPTERNGPFGIFNRWFAHATERYVGLAQGVIGHRLIHFGVYAAIVIVMALLFLRLPTGFLPTEDQGQAMVQYNLPAGATTERTQKVRAQVENALLQGEKKDVANLFTIIGFGFSGSGQNAGMGFASLAPFNARKGSKDSAAAITARVTQSLSNVREAQIFALTPAPIMGLGQSNGFSFQLLNTSGMSQTEFRVLGDKLLAAAQTDHRLGQVRAATLPDAPQLRVTFDDAKLAALGVSESDATDTLSTAWGGTYVDDFVDRGRVKRVYLQGDAAYRMLPDDLNGWYVRSSNTSTTALSTGVTSGSDSSGASTASTATVSAMAPFSAFATTGWEKGANTLTRFNGVASYEIDGSAAPGQSSGEAMKAIVELQKQVTPQAGYAWSDLSYQEQQSSGQALYLYGISIVVVFLCLAALYESWSVPFAVLLVIPLGVIGAVLAVTVRGLENNIYFQVGLLTTIGLAAKNAILIVEFAEMARRRGEDLFKSALEAARVRLRPILMTSIAFIAGVLPLAFARGAGAQSRIAIGTAVAGGMLTATALAIFYVPLFFVAVAKLFHVRDPAAKKEPEPPPADAQPEAAS